METNNFKVAAKGSCKISSAEPDEKTIKMALASVSSP